MPIAATRTVLHEAVQIISVFRKHKIDPLPNHLHHSLLPIPDGARTGQLDGFGELTVNFRTGHLVYVGEAEQMVEIDVKGHSQKTLFDALTAKLKDSGQIVDVSVEGLNTETHTFKSDDAALLMDMFIQMQTALAQTKAHFNGGQTPLVLWSHGFDLSSIWFPIGSSMIEESDPHMNIGFSPGTASMPEPYVYCYVYPVQEAVKDNLPANMNWETSWQTPGAVLPYSSLATSSDPVATVTQTLLTIYDVASKTLG